MPSIHNRLQTDEVTTLPETTLNIGDELVETVSLNLDFYSYSNMADRAGVAKADHHVMIFEQKTEPCGVTDEAFGRAC